MGRQSQRHVAVVTGDSAGVGRGTARAFAVRGYAVALLARGVQGLPTAGCDRRKEDEVRRELPSMCAFCSQLRATLRGLR